MNLADLECALPESSLEVDESNIPSSPEDESNRNIYNDDEGDSINISNEVPKEVYEDLDIEVEEEYIPIKYGPQHFELIKLLGEGAFGKVFLIHSRFQKTQYYAMKVLSKRLLKKKNKVKVICLA